MTKTVPINYVDKQTRKVKVDYIKKTAKYDFKPSQNYYPTHIMGACSVCKTVGTLDFPTGFDFKKGDAVMSRRKIKVFCVTCKKITEFIPVKIGAKETGQVGIKFLKNIENNLQKELIGS